MPLSSGYKIFLAVPSSGFFWKSMTTPENLTANFARLNKLAAHLNRECTDPITESIPVTMEPCFPPLVVPNLPPKNSSGLCCTPKAREGGTKMSKTRKPLIAILCLLGCFSALHLSIQSIVQVGHVGHWKTFCSGLPSLWSQLYILF